MNIDSYWERNVSFRILVGSGRHLMLRLLAVLVVWQIVLLAVCSYEGSLFLPGRDIGLLEDVFQLTLLFVLISATALVFYLLRNVEILLAKLPELVKAEPPGTHSSEARGLEESNRINRDSDAVRQFVGMRTFYSKVLFYGILALLTALVYVSQVHLPLFGPTPVRSWALWPSAYPSSFFVGTLWTIFWMVVVLGNAVWYSMSTAIAVFGTLARYARSDRLLIIPIAPDGKGGVSPIGNVSFALTLIASCGMISVVAWMLLFGLDLHLAIGSACYVLFLVGIFFIPLMSVHKAMLHAKAAETERIAALFRQEYLKLPPLSTIQKGTGESFDRREFRSSLQDLSELDQLYQRVRAMPVWPFDFTTIARFVSLVGIPMLLFIVQFLTQNAITRFLQSP